MNGEKRGATGRPDGKTPPVAIVGVSALFPGAPTTADFWRDILAGRDRLTDVPRTHWLSGDYYDPRPGTPDKVCTTRGGFLPEVGFSPLEFGLPPNVVQATDTAQLLALVVAKRALAEATRGRYESMDRSRMSVVLGVASATELVAHMSGRLQIPVAERAMRAAGLEESEIARVREVLAGCYVPWQESTFPGLLGNVVAGRIANRLDLGGTNSVIDAACASSLAAVDVGINELALGRSDLVLTGGVDTLNDILMFMCFAQTGALSPSGDCRPFSDDADGTMLGEGIGVLALKRLDDAERDGDPIYAVIRGIGTSSDGRGNSIYAPDAEGQALALRRAYERAGYGPETVGLIEAHGTATTAGDAAEVEALKAVFEAATARKQSCALGSVKAQIGHTKAAAGSAGLIKAVMALHHKVLPQTIKVRAPNPKLALDASPLYLNTETRPWIQGDESPRRASVSALGFGGTNFHVAVEEYRGQVRPARIRTCPTELVLLGGADARDVAARCRELAEELASGTFVHVAKRSQLAFDAGAPARLAIVASGETDLHESLLKAAERLDENDAAFSLPRGVHFAAGAAAGPVAVLFPGQGSQYVGMGRDLAVSFECVRAEWDRFADVGAEERLADVVFPPPAWRDEAKKALDARLTATEWAQPAIAATSLAMVRLVERLGVTPICAGGHSLGEVTALGACGGLERAAVVAIARRRGELVAHAADRPGAMTAVAAGVASVEAALAGSGIDVVVANHNAPNQVVLSGPVEEIERAEAHLRAASLAGRRLPVSTAFHSPLVKGACAPFRSYLDGMPAGPTSVPVYSNRTGTPYPADASKVREDLARALAAPVRFVEQIDAMYTFGARVFLEVGPGSVLTKLVERCLGDRPHVAVALDARGKNGVTALWDALARLSVVGVKLDLAALWEGDALPDDPTLALPSKLVLPLTGANYDKPYPPRSGELPPAPVTPRVAKPAHAGPVATPPATMHAMPAMPLHAIPTTAEASSLQASLIAAQMEYQHLMAESHIAFLQAMTGAPIDAAANATAMPASAMAMPPVAMAMPAPVALAPLPAPPPVTPALAPVSSAIDLVALTLGIVAEKTGYPAEMIELTMDLESDLGIDSIKRVEILSAVRDRAPGLPEIDTARMARMRTLQEIVAFLGASAPAAAPAQAKSVDLVGLTLGIVAEKTGYPAEMIELTMDLESDLGIDSIKRVEILSAVRDRAPGLPEIDTARMARMRTLQEIVAFLGGGHSNGAPAPSPSPVNGATKAKAPRSDASFGRFATRAVDAPPRGLALRGLFGPDGIVVTADGGEVAAEVVRRLQDHGLSARVVDAVPADAGAVVFLGGLRSVAGVDEALAVNHDAFVAARAVAARFRERGGAFVTVQDTGGDFSLNGRAGDRAWLAGLGALAKTAAAEWTKAAARAIDIDRGPRDDDAVADAIVRELLHGGTEIEVGLDANGRRSAIVATSAPALEAGRTIPSGAVFVVTGGARGVTAAAMIELARGVRGLRLLLLGRTALSDEPAAFAGVDGDAALKRAALDEASRGGATATPKDIAKRVAAIVTNREVRENIRRLEAAGAEVRYAAVDVQNRAALEHTIADARSAWGPVRGVVHGAGVLSDALIENKTDAQFSSVWSTKVLGLRALLDATRGDPLEWLCLFSSVAARAGNAGQADYAMANEVLNKVAAVEARRRGDACRVVSIGWGPWDGGMVTPTLRTHFESRGVKLLAIEAGTQAFVRELTGQGDVEVVVAGDPDLGAGDEPRRLEATVLVNETTWPQLASHRIKGNVVLPMAVALEWFARLAKPLLDAGRAVHFRDLRVVRGVPLADYFGAGDRFHLSGEPHADGASFALELRDARGDLRYAATLDLRPVPSPGASTPPGELASSPWSAEELYGPSTLFHGSHFHVLDRVDGISSTHARATVRSTRDAGWPNAEWHAEPAALDGALQLAILFGIHGGGGPTLPMRIESVIYRPGHDTGPIHCELFGRSRTRERLLCDVSLAGAGGERVLDLVGVEMFAMPSGTTAS